MATNPFYDTMRRGLEGAFGGSSPITAQPQATSSTTQPTGATNGTIDQLLSMLQPQQNPLADLSSILGGFSSGEKANRVVEGNFQGDFDRMMLDRERSMNTLGLQAQADRNVNEADALRKLQQTSYIAGGGSQFGPQNIVLGGQVKTLPQFAGMMPPKITDAEKQGAQALQGQMLSRLSPGGSFQPQWNYQPKPVDEYAKPGLMEQIGSYGGAITGGIGAIDRLLGGGGQGPISGLADKGLGKLGGWLGLGGAAAPAIGGLLQGGAIPLVSKVGHLAVPGALTSPGIAGGFSSGAGAAGNAAATGATGAAGAGSTLGGLLSKAVPIAGAVTGGLGLMKDRGVASNLMNGVTTGMSIGSIVPGIGTAVGAGIGALVGGLRSIGGGPSEEELAGRKIASSVRQSLVSTATPANIQEAQNSGWRNPMDALPLVVLRDRLSQRGITDPNLSMQLMDQLWKAEKAGPQAAAQVGQQIMQLLGGR